MSFRVVRQSKFRHIFGQNVKREQCYDNIRVSKAAWDSTFCTVNPKFLAVIVESGGGGAFLVLPLNKTGRLSPDAPLVAGHKGPVLDIAWCPHNDNVIASGSEDCIVKVWKIPENGITRTLTESVVDLVRHQRRVGLVLWHPSAHNILLSAGADNLVVMWNVGTGEALVSFNLPDLVYSGSWNWDGSEVLFTCKDRKIRRVDPRSGNIEEEAVAHEGNKASRAIYLKNGLVFTTGFTKHSERQYSLRAPGHLDEPIVMVELDTSNGVMFPMYDPDANLVYLCGKGDSVIRYFEITSEPPFVHYINTYQSSEPQRGIGMMSKRGCDFSICEMARFYRLNNSGFCQVIPFVVPRKSELFQEDLYPDTQAEEPAISADEWWQGTNAEPVLVPVTEAGVAQGAKKELTVAKPNILDRPVRKTSTNASNGSDNNASAAAPTAAAPQIDLRTLTMAIMEEVQKRLSETEQQQKERLDEQAAEIRKLKAMIVKHESRIRALETRNTENNNDNIVDNNANIDTKNNGDSNVEHMEPDEV